MGKVLGPELRFPIIYAKVRHTRDRVWRQAGLKSLLAKQASQSVRDTVSENCRRE